MPKKQQQPRAGIKSASAPPTAAGKKKAAAKKKGGAGGGAVSASAARLIEQAQQALLFDDYNTALICLREAAEREPENLEALDAYGSLLAEVGRVEEAVAVLRGAVELAPDSGFEKYMYLGQVRGLVAAD